MYTDLFFFLEVLLVALRGHIVPGMLFGEVDGLLHHIKCSLCVGLRGPLRLELCEAVYKHTKLNALHSR